MLKNHLRKEGSESVTRCNRLKLPAADDKHYLADVEVKAHKTLKGLNTQNLRDHMSKAELIFTALAEFALSLSTGNTLMGSRCLHCLQKRSQTRTHCSQWGVRLGHNAMPSPIRETQATRADSISEMRFTPHFR